MSAAHIPTKQATPADPANFSLDQQLLQRRFAASAASCDEADPLSREVSRRMDERLDYIRLEPQRILDLGCGNGADLSTLQARYPQALVIGADFALPRLQRARPQQPPRPQKLLKRLFSTPSSLPSLPLVSADAARLPFAYQSFDLLWSNLLLASIDDPRPILREMQRCLRVGGLLMFSTLGPDTLQELRTVLPARTGSRVHRFIDMHDLGDALVDTGFADPVMDMEKLTLTYGELDRLFADLRGSGAANAASDRPRGLSGRQGWAQARAAYEALRDAGRLPVSIEIVQAHAWKAEPKTVADGRSIVHFQPRQPRQPQRTGPADKAS